MKVLVERLIRTNPEVRRRLEAGSPAAKGLVARFRKAGEFAGGPGKTISRPAGGRRSSPKSFLTSRGGDKTFGETETKRKTLGVG